MAERPALDPARALDQLFKLIQQEAIANPAFGRRLLEAVGHTVIYRGEQAVEAVDPVLVGLRGFEEFRRTFASMKVAEVKKVGLTSGLFAKSEKLPRTQAEMIDLLWSRTQQRTRDILPGARIAAE